MPEEQIQQNTPAATPDANANIPETLGALANKPAEVSAPASPEEPATASDSSAETETPAQELIDGKFKSVDDLLKSYKELQKKKDEGAELKKNFGAPEDGEYTIPIEDAEVAEKFLAKAGKSVELLNNIAKANNFSQDMYNNLFNKLTEHVQGKLESARSELLSLDNAPERLQTLNNWFGQNFDFSEFPSVQNVPMTKDMLVFFETVKSKMTGASNMAFIQTSETIKAGTLEEAHKEMATNYDKYKTDPSYQKAMRARIEQLERQHGRDSYGQPNFGKR